MSRLERVLERDKKAFVPYIMAGDGGIKQLVPRLQFLQKAGATMIEIGIPFSDPAADGPVIQEAGLRALKEGTTIHSVLHELENVRETIDIPLIFMTYLNPILAVGIEEFSAKCQKIGIDGCIIPDMPMEEEGEVKSLLNNNGLALIRLVSITSPAERIKKLTQDAEGFIYAVTVKGVTGVRSEFADEVISYVKELKRISPIPVLAGFGISTPEQVRMMSEQCDGVIVGSQIIKHFQEREENQIISLIQSADRLRSDN